GYIFDGATIDAYGSLMIHGTDATDESDFLLLKHDGTDGYIYSGVGDIVFYNDIKATGPIKIREQEEPAFLDGYSQLWTDNDEHSSLILTDGYDGGVIHYLASNYVEMFLTVSAASENHGSNTYGKMGGTTGAGIFHGNFTVGSGNRITWTGKRLSNFMFTCAVSFTTDGTTQNVTLALAKNGVVAEKTEIERNISTGADVGAMYLQGAFTLDTDDYVELYGKIDASNAITITKMNMIASPL
ncbi:hypothetical protein LCGC14_1323810, partial [marine sediment metagenome]